MNKDVAYGIVKSLEALAFTGKIYVCGFLVERIVNDQDAVWVMFTSSTLNAEDFQYTPGGQWKYLDKNGNVLN
jgi:hypothetical protein